MTDEGERVREYHNMLKHVLNVLPTPTNQKEKEAVEYIQREIVYAKEILQKDAHLEFVKARRQSLQRSKDYYRK
jgi:hypothetical protein